MKPKTKLQHPEQKKEGEVFLKYCDPWGLDFVITKWSTARIGEIVKIGGSPSRAKDFKKNCAYPVFVQRTEVLEKIERAKAKETSTEFFEKLLEQE